MNLYDEREDRTLVFLPSSCYEIYYDEREGRTLLFLPPLCYEIYFNEYEIIIIVQQTTIHKYDNFLPLFNVECSVLHPCQSSAHLHGPCPLLHPSTIRIKVWQ